MASAWRRVLLSNAARRRLSTEPLLQQQRGFQRQQQRGSKEERALTIDDIQLQFLGTSSGSPSSSRNQQALLMQFCGQTWLFDAGEAAQHRMMLTTVSPPSVRRVFVSHMHGDHVFGLPGLLCNMATAYGGGNDGPGQIPGYSKLDSTAEGPVEIVGPQGLRSWLRAVLANSYATLGAMQLTVHELHGLRAVEKGPVHMRPPIVVERPLPNEQGGLDLVPDEQGRWRIPLGAREPPMSVHAVELDHTVPTVGWVLTEQPRPGKLDAEAVLPLLREHNVHPRVLREFKSGSPITLPDGTVLEPADYVGPSTQRKLAILSDMRGFKAGVSVEPLVRDATLLVHECTNAWLQDDQPKKLPADVERSARAHGHSTPEMAGRLARRLRARHLVLTHFSPRYGGGTSHFDRSCMAEIRNAAAVEFGAAHRVITALDLMRLCVHIDGKVERFLPAREELPTLLREAPRLPPEGGSRERRTDRPDGPAVKPRERRRQQKAGGRMQA